MIDYIKLHKQYLAARVTPEDILYWGGESMITQLDIDNWFIYHPPDLGQIPRYSKIREKAHELAMIILENTPSNADQTAAIRKLRECVMTANAAIACGENSI